MAQARPADGYTAAGQKLQRTRYSPHSVSPHPLSTRRNQAVSRLSDHGAGGRGLVLPGGREDADGLVVAGQTVDTRLDENQAELGVLVLAVALKVLSDGNSLADRLAGYFGSKIFIMTCVPS